MYIRGEGVLCNRILEIKLLINLCWSFISKSTAACSRKLIFLCNPDVFAAWSRQDSSFSLQPPTALAWVALRGEPVSKEIWGFLYWKGSLRRE